MANQGKVSINSDTLNTVASKISSSASSLESDIGAKLPGVFEGLSTIGLYSNGLTKIKEQVSYLSDTMKNISTEVTSHISSTEKTEDELTNSYNGRSNYTPSGGGYSGASLNSGDNSNNEEDDGKKVNPEKIIDVLNKIDDSTVDKLISFINVKKDEIPLTSLLFNYDRSKKLYKTILEAFGYDVDDLDGITESQYKEVQKALIETIFKSETVPIKLQNNSILTAKEYLVLIAKNNNISVSDLLMDSKYSKVLKASLKDLYDGAIPSDCNVSDATVNSFRTFVDGVASDNNMNYNEVLDNISLLL